MLVSNIAQKPHTNVEYTLISMLSDSATQRLQTELAR